MSHLQIIELRAAQALTEIRLMANEARAELKFMMSVWNRSQGQLRRYARQRREVK